MNNKGTCVVCGSDIIWFENLASKGIPQACRHHTVDEVIRAVKEGVFMTFGGFVSDNIRRWLLKEILQSGDPADFFLALHDEFEKIEDEQKDPAFWDRAWDEIDAA